MIVLSVSKKGSIESCTNLKFNADDASCLGLQQGPLSEEASKSGKEPGTGSGPQSLAVLYLVLREMCRVLGWFVCMP